jgi:hypothetical protein
MSIEGHVSEDCGNGLIEVRCPLIMSLSSTAHGPTFVTGKSKERALRLSTKAVGVFAVHWESLDGSYLLGTSTDRSVLLHIVESHWLFMEELEHRSIQAFSKDCPLFHLLLMLHCDGCVKKPYFVFS